MTSTRAAALFGTIFGGIATLLGLVMMLASGLGLLILPWTVTTLVSGLTVRRSLEGATSLARFAAIWAVMSSLVFAIIIALTFDIGISGVLIFWLLLTVTIPLVQLVLCHRAGTATGRMASQPMRPVDAG